MATQLAPQADEGTEALPDNDDAPILRDYEAEAKHHGWTPKEEFKGDPARWVDAETFVTRADEVMPLLKKQNDAFKRENADLRKQIRRASDHFSKAEERAYDRALQDIQERQDKAAQAGDVEGVRKATNEIKELASQVPSSRADIAREAQEAAIDWRAENPWYDKPGLMRDFADLQVEKLKHMAPEMAPADFFAMIGEKVKERFGDRMKEEATPQRQRAASAVEGVSTNRVRRGEHSFNDLPQKAKEICDKWVKSGLIKDREAYVKTYQWDDKK